MIESQFVEHDLYGVWTQSMQKIKVKMMGKMINVYGHSGR